MCCGKEKKMTELKDFMSCFYMYILYIYIYVYISLNSMFLDIG